MLICLFAEMSLQPLILPAIFCPSSWSPKCEWERRLESLWNFWS